MSVFLHRKRLSWNPICKNRTLGAYPTLIYLLNTEVACEEKVISRDPCEKITCPQGHEGRREMVFYDCPRLPDPCPLNIKNNSATCCPDKCGKEP